jgi:hypothetical protein
VDFAKREPEGVGEGDEVAAEVEVAQDAWNVIDLDAGEVSVGQGGGAERR